MTNDFNDLAEILQKKEELHPDLLPWLIKEQEPTWSFTCLKHPLVFSIMYTPEMNALLNRQYTVKKEHLEKALAKKDWGLYIALHERPYRFNALLEIHEQIEDNKQYWELVSSTWTDSENIWQVKPLVKKFLLSKRSNKEYLMYEDERNLLASLPDTIKIYRGHQGRNKRSYSWTLSYWKAKWFANRFGEEGSVSTAICKKEEVIALLLGRGEFEIITNPSRMTIQPFKKVPRATWIKKVEKIALDEFKLSKRSLHGPWHWEKVELNAVKLAEMNGADPVVAQLFALLHDCCRTNENDDPKHGKRAGILCEKLFRQNMLKIDAMQLKTLIQACEYHENGETSDDLTIGSCWDADRLDLLRVGIVPDEKLLSTTFGKELMWKI